MRLSNHDRQAIVDTVRSYDPAASVYLHGSRCDLIARGGDIDLLIISDRLEDSDKNLIGAKLWQALGEQQIDILIERRTFSTTPDSKTQLDGPPPGGTTPLPQRRSAFFTHALSHALQLT